MSDPIIRVEGLGKKYRLHHEAKERYTALRDVIARRVKRLFQPGAGIQAHPASSDEDFWALKDVSFDVQPGEVLGIIGRNGAGKSTLLKILARITEPTTGRITLNGRVASLLEVGTGFHPELTGRENIFLNGAILGMTKAEIRAKFDEIVAFSEVERFLDTPVKRYSSGMYVRLAFGVAAHLEPEILVVDEVLAVGDAEFQRKCLGKMQDVAKSGRTVLFVSHNMSAVLNLCSRAVLLTSGQVQNQGNVSSMVSEYLAIRERASRFSPQGKSRSGDQQVCIENFKVAPEQPATGRPVTFVFDLARAPDSNDRLPVELGVAVLTEQGARLLLLFSGHVGVRFQIPKGRSTIEVTVDSLPLMPGNYSLNLWVGSGETPLDWIRDCYDLCVAPGALVEGVYLEDRGYPVVATSQWRMEPSHS